MGPPVDLTSVEYIGRVVYPANACNAPASQLATASRVGLSALFIVTGAWTCTKLLANGLSYSMGGGSE